MSSSRVPSTRGRTRFTSTARARVPSIESTATVYAIQASAVRAAPRSAASTARMPAAALLAVSRWTAQAAARRSGPVAAVTPGSRRESRPPWAALYCEDGGPATAGRAAQCGVGHDAAGSHQELARRRRCHAVRRIDRPLPHEAASRAERHHEVAHEDRRAGRVAGRTGDERAGIAEIALAVSVGVDL